MNLLKQTIKEALDADAALLSAGGRGELTTFNKKVETFLNETFETLTNLLKRVRPSCVKTIFITPQLKNVEG